jgi:hypothetical protein
MTEDKQFTAPGSHYTWSTMEDSRKRTSGWTFIQSGNSDKTKLGKKWKKVDAGRWTVSGKAWRQVHPL